MGYGTVRSDLTRYCGSERNGPVSSYEGVFLFFFFFNIIVRLADQCQPLDLIMDFSIFLQLLMILLRPFPSGNKQRSVFTICHSMVQEARFFSLAYIP